MIKVLYDYLGFKEKYGGVSRSFVKMILCLSDEIAWTIPVKNTHNEYIKELKTIELKMLFGNFYFKGKWRLMDLQNRLYAIQQLKKGKFDIYYQTHYDPYAYKYLGPKIKKVTTMQDMNYFIIPEAYKNYSCHEVMEWQKISASKADKIVTPSSNTKKDLMDLWKIPDEKITVVYYGSEIVPLEKYNLIKKIKEPYILFVGTRHVYKNFFPLLKVFSILCEHNSDLALVCTGSDFNREELNRMTELKIQNKVYQIAANENDMVNLYYNAEVFVYPSLYEGFGLPLLEAMNCDCPVCCSNTSCFPEVAGNAAAYFDPYSLDSMCDVISSVLSDSTYRTKLIKAGRIRRTLYTWQKCADAHKNIYKELML
jgi:glycosyltransferase involved in cell wall biosynthesis